MVSEGERRTAHTGITKDKNRLQVKVKKQLAHNGVKATEDRVQHQIDLCLWPYRCEKRDDGEGRERVRGLGDTKNSSRETRSPVRSSRPRGIDEDQGHLVGAFIGSFEFGR